MLRYFKSSLIAAVIGLVLAALLGYFSWGGWQGISEALFLVAILAVLEVSLSFDNAIVNAKVLGQMSPLWRHRFLTWGMVIAVFVMRLLFPLLIVAGVAQINPWAALMMALLQPSQYAALMLSAHLSVVAFGGSFLLMVAFEYFYDDTKTLHWIDWLEQPLAKIGRWKFVKWILASALIAVIAVLLPQEERKTYVLASCVGFVTYGFVALLGLWLKKSPVERRDLHRASLGLFVYLEVLDASFSFDGVVGAFAITDNLLIILLGLSIGAFFVRSFTLVMVDKGTLAKFSYLEHGAFYAIGALALILLAEPFVKLPEWLTGLLGGGIVLVALFWSRYAPLTKPPAK